MNRYLGIDYGTKRIGVALSDEDGGFAFPKAVIEVKNDAQVFAELKAMAVREKVRTVVVGLPLNFDFQETPQTHRVKAFVEKLKKELPDTPVVFENEVLSTKEAEKSGGVSKNMIDASSAAILLQSFLDRHRQK